MKSFDYKDEYGDALEIRSVGAGGKVAAFKVRSAEGVASVSVTIPAKDLTGVVESILETVELGCYILPKTDAVVRSAGTGWIGCGTGNAYVETHEEADPKTLLAKATHIVTIAQEIERRKRLAATEQSWATRRDKVTQELSGSPAARYEFATELAQKAIDRILGMEDKKEEDKNA